MGLKDWIEAPAASVVPAARSKLNLLRGAAARLTTPLLPDDYLHLANPLWSARELRGQIVEVRPETTDSATIVIKPGWGFDFNYQPGQYIGIGLLSTAVGIGGRTHLPRLPTGRTSAFPSRSRPCPRAFSSHLVSGPCRRDHRSTGHALRQLRVAGSAAEKILFITAGSGITPVMGHVADDEPARSIARRHAHPLGSDGIRRDVRRRTHSNCTPSTRTS